MEAISWLRLNHKLMLAGVVVITLSLSGCRLYSDGVQKPQPQGGTGQPTQVTPPTTKPVLEPFGVGEVIVQNNTVYRQYHGMSDRGGYVVQDFYLGTQQKRTEPYVMTRFNELQTLLFENDGDAVSQYNRLTQAGIGIDGAYVQWYPNASQAIEGGYVGNLPSGEWLLSYESGSPMLQDTWLDGMRNGASKGWHTNGQLAGQGDYAHNFRQGVWTVWYSNGTKMQEGSYYNGQQEGNWIFWFDNAALKEAGSYFNGLRIGKWQWWTRDGVLARDGEYDETGKLKGSAVGSGVIKPREF